MDKKLSFKAMTNAIRKTQRDTEFSEDRAYKIKM